MRIDELSGYRDNPIYKKAQDVFSSPEAGERYSPLDHGRRNQLLRFSDYLAQYGFRYVGQGFYGIVFEKPGYPYIFKVFKEDPGYLSYVRFCKSHQDNVHIPKIKGNIIKINDDTYAIRTEKLRPIEGRVGNAITSMSNYMRKIYRYERLSDFAKQDLEELSVEYPGIYELFKYFLENGYNLDMHSENLMMRGSDIVLTDPVTRGS